MQRFDRTGTVEVSLVGTQDMCAVVRLLEQITRDQGGALHWGQSNGQPTFLDLEATYPTTSLTKWRDAQRTLGGTPSRIAS